LSSDRHYVQIDGIAKRFGQVEALRDVSIDVPKGEFVALLGPSGCGKTTLLRILAGLETPDRGRLLVNGKDITHQPANRREIGVVFQNYALFPHLTVFENVAFGLRMRRTPRAQQLERVRAALAAVQLSGFDTRYPRQLSGGQQQRVALARGLAIEPTLLLLDEPLSSLDARLRRQVRLELRALQKRLGITTLFVTHDQEEALALADRLIVMRNGAVEQTGEPEEVYRKPSTSFSAAFVGEANLLPAVATRTDGDMVEVRLSGGEVLSARAGGPVRSGESGYLVVRQEDVVIGKATEGIPATVEVTAFLGSATLCVCRLDNSRIPVRARLEGDAHFAIGQRVALKLAASRAMFLVNPEPVADSLSEPI
jgi:spermidine/putrescine ABC transporter ATP-binding subunit